MIFFSKCSVFYLERRNAFSCSTNAVAATSAQVYDAKST